MYPLLYLALWTHTWNKARCRSPYIMATRGGKSRQSTCTKRGSGAVGQEGERGGARGGSLFAARWIFPRSSTSSERSSGFLPLSIIRIVADSGLGSPRRTRPTTPWGILAKEGRIIRGLHNGESWLQRRAAEANCQTRKEDRL